MEDILPGLQRLTPLITILAEEQLVAAETLRIITVAHAQCQVLEQVPATLIQRTITTLGDKVLLTTEALGVILALVVAIAVHSGTIRTPILPGATQARVKAGVLLQPTGVTVAACAAAVSQA